MFIFDTFESVLFHPQFSISPKKLDLIGWTIHENSEFVKPFGEQVILQKLFVQNEFYPLFGFELFSLKNVL